MMHKQDLAPMCQFIQQQKPGFQPKVALILGSGLGELAEQIQAAVIIPFSDIPDFPHSTVAGHAGKMILGYLGDMPVVCMQGRIHRYEGAESTHFKKFIRLLKLLGCESLFITNASGSLNPDLKVGELALIHDHINFQQWNPLIGLNDDEFGERFFDITHSYDIALRQRITQIAKQLQVPLKEGVYISVNGPCFETPAEIRAFRHLGADVVGMSTVPEVLVARHCGLRVAAIASVTNMASGLTQEQHSHAATLHFAKLAAVHLHRLIPAVLESLVNDPC